MQKIISIVVPVFNEEKNIQLITQEIERVFATIPNYSYELIFVNDGSGDNSQEVIDSLISSDSKIKSIEFSRNFGKEFATSAGLEYAKGDAVMMIDADLQHPVGLIPKFIEKWEAGFEQIIGVRISNKSTGIIKKVCSKLFYFILNSMSETRLISGTTDFRLIDRKVVDEFNKLAERNRITRGLLAWLGFKQTTIEFKAPKRVHGEASYSYPKLIKLALSSFVSHSLFPLKLAGYMGIFITLFSGLLGIVVFIERYIYDDIWRWHFSGSAQLAILNVFLIGIVLTSLGLIALYIGNINGEVSGRPLYIIRNKKNM